MPLDNNARVDKKMEGEKLIAFAVAAENYDRIGIMQDTEEQALKVLPSYQAQAPKVPNMGQKATNKAWQPKAMEKRQKTEEVQHLIPNSHRELALERRAQRKKQKETEEMLLMQNPLPVIQQRRTLDLTNPDCINPDEMSYEQLLELGEMIGKVNKGLTKTQIDVNNLLVL